MAFSNRIRLPIELVKPQFIDESERYRKANGVTVTLFSSVRKVYEGVTDYLPEKIHERLKIALVHDNVQIEADRYVGVVTQEGSYDIEWPEFKNKPLATAKFKAEVSPFNATNSNCGTCQEFTQVVANDDNLGDLDEGQTATFNPLTNDQICCSPVAITIVTTNSDYVNSISINPSNNNITIQIKDPAPEANGVILASYRAQCQNGQYDDANIIANINGSIPTCLAPINLSINSISTTTATADWDAPTPAPASYDWEIYDINDLGTPIATGNTSNTFVNITGLTQTTNYRFFVRGNCGGGSTSNFISADFKTLSEDAAQFCGSYKATNNSFFIRHISWVNCTGATQEVILGGFQEYTFCALQSSPGVPVDITASPFYVTITYLGIC